MATETTSKEDAPSTAKKRLRDAANLVMEYLREPHGKSRADVAHAFDKVLGRWMDNRFKRSGVPPDQAEELTMEVWCKLLEGKHLAHTNAFALIYRVAYQILVDHIRSNHALKNRINGEKSNSAAEIKGDDDLWNFIQETKFDELKLTDIDLFELRDCLTRVFHEFSRQYAEKSQLFIYLAEDLTYEEIAFIVFQECTEDNSKKFTNRIRNRIEEARKKASSFFQKCRD